MTTSVIDKIKNRIGNEKLITNAVKLFGFCQDFYKSIQRCADIVTILINNIPIMSNRYAT